MNDGPMDDAPKLMNFSEALAAVKATFGIARTGWNGKGLVGRIQVPDDDSANTLPYLFIVYPNDHAKYPGARCPWLASQTDLLRAARRLRRRPQAARGGAEVSPIRPENRARYPKDWPAIRERIMERAQNRCECRGECGLEHEPWGGLTGPDGVRRTGERVCRAPHSRFILRDADAPAAWDQHEPGEDCDWRCEEGCRAVKVVLTIAHLNHTPEDNRPSNLRAFCQLCHNRYDREHRNATAASTRHKRRAAADLFAEATDDA